MLNNKPSKILWFIPLLMLAVASGFKYITDYDFWWHLITGEIIWRWHEIPRFDFFSYTAQGMPWVNHEWLYQVIIYFINNNLGTTGIVLTKFLVTCSIIYIVFRTTHKLTSSHALSALGVLFVVLGIADRILDRPSTIGLMFLAIYLYSIHDFVLQKGKLIWFLPIFQVLWINIHGGGILGLYILYAVALAETIQLKLNTENIAVDKGQVLQLWKITIISMCTIILNPYGMRVYFFALGHLQMNAIMEGTMEWLSPLDPRFDGYLFQIIFCLVLVMTIMSHLINRRRVRLSFIFLTVLTGFLTLKGKRFTPDFIIVNTPIAISNFVSWYRARQSYSEGPSQPNPIYSWTIFFIMICVGSYGLLRGIPLSIKGGDSGKIGIGVARQVAPDGMVNFLDANNIHGRMFNELGLGGFLIYKRWPSDLVFVDGRTPVYGDKFYKEYFDSVQFERNFAELDKKYSFDYLLFKADTAWAIRGFHEYLWRSGDWRLVFADSREGFIYLRNIDKYKNIIDKYALAKHPLLEEMKLIK